MFIIKIVDLITFKSFNKKCWIGFPSTKGSNFLISL